MLAFFPWLELDEDVSLPVGSLVRFDRGRRPGGQLQATLDALLAPFVVGADRPISKATLIQLPEHGLIDDLTEGERDEVFAVGELVAFAGLAAREYFAPFHYANRDTFTLVIQAFTEPGVGVGVRSRRRDGSSSTYVSPGAYRVRQPQHLAGTGGVRLDVPLLEALLKVREVGGWPELEEAIFFFNRANSDSDQIFEQAEIVSTTSAIERVLGCRGGTERELADRFTGEWKASRCLLPRESSRFPRDQEQFQHRSIAESWIRDFFRHRGNVGHGRKRTEHPAVWSAEEHLLLGAYAFPLLVKLILAQKGYYLGTWEDQLDVDVFEELACAQLFAQIPDPVEDDEEAHLVWPWHQIRGAAHLRRALEIAFERVIDQSPEPIA